MPAPAFKIPVQVDLDSLKRQMDAGANHVGQAARFMGQQFEKLNGTIVAGGGAAGAAYASGFAAAALRVVGSIGLIVAAAKVLGSIIEITREQLQQMVAIADKAQTANVSPRFFQGFVAEADKLKVKAEDLETALTAAFNATKDKAPIDVDAWSVGEEKISDVEKALRVYNATVAKSAGVTLDGLIGFRDAATQEDKIKAVLNSMIQLDSLGQHLASLDVGEKMFGAAFIDRIRQGRTSAQEMLKTIEDSAAASNNVFTNETIRRAKDIDDQLKRAHQTLDKNLKPTWDSLADKMLTIKSLWADVVELVAKAAAAAGRIGLLPAQQVATLVQKQAELVDLEEKLAQASQFSGTVIADRRNAALVVRIAALKEEIKSLQEDARDASVNAGIQSGPSRGTGAAPAPPKKEEEKDKQDGFDRAIAQAEKNTLVLDAETASLDLNAAARARAKVVAELTAAAIAANTKAGLENTGVSEEQAARINEVADAYEQVALKAELAHTPLNQFARDAKDIDTGLQNAAVGGLRGFEDALIDIGSGARNTKDAFKDMTESILKDIARLVIRQAITGPIAGVLGGFLGFSQGGLVGAGAPAVPRFAPGGFVSGPGSSTSDSIPAFLSNGEFVVRSAQASRHRDLLEAINNGRLAAGATAAAEAPTILFQAGPRSDESVRNLFRDLVRVSRDMPVRLKLA